MENYVKADVLHEALQALHPKLYGGQSGVNQYDHSFYFKRKRPPNPEGEIFKKADKVGAALIVCEKDADLNVLDLRKRIEELASMIRKANGID